MTDLTKLPYSHSRMAGNLCFTSGQVGLNEGKLVEGGFPAQMEQAIENLIVVLAGAGLTMRNVVKVTVFLADMKYFGEFNGLYARYFQTPYPARSTVVAAPPVPGALFEIEAVAYKED